MNLGNTIQNFSVFQRNINNVSEHTFYGSSLNSGNVLLTIKDVNGSSVNNFYKKIVGKAQNNLVRGIIEGLPTGGPYTLIIEIENSKEKAIYKNILVGDLWLLAGQSNIADYGSLPSLTKSNPMVHAFYMTNQWGIAKDPLHDTNRAAAPVHGGNPNNPPKTINGRGAGPGLPFAITMYEETQIPQGIIACSHGGTSLAQWNPKLKNLGDNSLYGAMYNRLQNLGGKVAGFLWYQGCNDTKNSNVVNEYFNNTKEIFQSIRKDCGNSQLPIVFVQLGPFIADKPDTQNSSKYWIEVRNQQYLISLKMKNTVCVPAIDLELCDQIHLSNNGVSILGKRLAEAMLSIFFPEKYPAQIKVKNIHYKTDLTTNNAKVEITFDNVCGKLKSSGYPCGFSLLKDGHYISDAINCQLTQNKATVLLKIPEVLFNENYQISYGGNFQPHANVKDEANRSLPCFILKGKAKPTNETYYITEALVSNPYYGSEKLTDLALPNDEDFNNLKFSIAQNSNIYLRCPDSENTNNPRKYFFRFQIELKENMVLNALLGSDAPFTLYCNKNEIMRHYATNPIVKDKFAAKIDLPAGRHEFIVVFSSNNNQGWGFCCKFIRLDGKTAPKVLKPDEFI